MRRGSARTLPCGCLAEPRAWEPNLTWITDDLAVGGSFPVDRVERLAEAHRVGAVVDVRREERDDRHHLARHGLRFLHLPTEDHGALTRGALAEGVAFARDARDRGLRLLVHCEHGIGRSATLALCVLVDRGMAPLEALLRAKDRRAVLSPSPAQYECWAAWLRGRPDLEPSAVPGFDAFKAIAYRHLLAG